jgi:hypothetical protein
LGDIDEDTLVLDGSAQQATEASNDAPAPWQDPKCSARMFFRNDEELETFRRAMQLN